MKTEERVHLLLDGSEDVVNHEGILHGVGSDHDVVLEH